MMSEKQQNGDILQKLLPEYVSLYHIELNSGKYEILRLADNTNARKLADRKLRPFATYDEYSKKYADTFILEDERKEFLDWHSCAKMKNRFLNADKQTYHYHSVSKDGKDSYYEAYAVKEKVDDQTFFIYLGYRNIDSILYKEKAIQEQLQRALDEVNLSNEIISSIAKTYQYISRIDIQADTFEEIVNRDKVNLNFIKNGILSTNNQKVCRLFVAEEYQEAFFKFTDLNTLAERMKAEESISLEYRMKDGNWHKMRFIEKKRDAAGNLTHVLCAIRSISDAKKREQELMYQVAEAKKETALKTKFLSNMSHDIRTPMNGIIGMLELANRYPNDLEMQKKCRDKIMESSRYLVSLMNDILDMNKLESDEIPAQNIPFNLAKLLSRANTESQRQAINKKIEYVVDWSKSELRYQDLIGNPLYLERMLKAVADNAIKFTDPGGRVRVWCAEKYADKGQVVYEFCCADNGIGMSEAFIGHAFEMFSQENKTSRSRYEGSGLGLAIAKKIADKLNATIELKSQRGVGTTVLMTVPFQIGEAVKEEKIKRPARKSLKGRRALVAEDNDLNMEIVRCILEEAGMEIECAFDGAEAVQKFEQSAPGYYQVICMDIMMPNLNGWDAARKIRTMRRTDADSIPIIAMSANAFTEDIINSRISGMNRHLAKPLDAEKLLQTMIECIS